MSLIEQRIQKLYFRNMLSREEAAAQLIELGRTAAEALLLLPPHDRWQSPTPVE